MELVANGMDWAKHRRRKAAAKAHMRLNLQSLLPNFVIVDTAGEHDNKRARELCAGVRPGEIVLFDKGYVDFGHLKDLDEREVCWVTRAKDNMAYQVVKRMRVSQRSVAHRWPLVERSLTAAAFLAATVVGASVESAASIVHQLLTER